MTKRTTQRPTDAELAILRVLWERGPSTVRQVHEILSEIRPTVYTTILKLMQIMDDKGLVRRDKSQRAHVYQASIHQSRDAETAGWRPAGTGFQRLNGESPHASTFR